MKAILVVCILMLCCGIGYADLIGPNCGSCFGSTYKLTNLGLQSTAGNTETWRIELEIDTSGYNGNASFLNAVAVGVTSDAISATLPLFPLVRADWSDPVVVGNLNANGCHSGNANNACVQWVPAGSPYGLAVNAPTPYTWDFDIVMGENTLKTGASKAHVAALYVDSKGKHNGISSEDITLGPGNVDPPNVPEPASVLLLGTALFLTARTIRRHGSHS